MVSPLCSRACTRQSWGQQLHLAANGKTGRAGSQQCGQFPNRFGESSNRSISMTRILTTRALSGWRGVVLAAPLGGDVAPQVVALHGGVDHQVQPFLVLDS